MNDFSAKVKAAEREASAKAKSSQNTSPYGLKKDGTPRKRPAPKSAWKKGEPGNPDTLWKPGESGNPGGRPQKTPITDAMRVYLQMPYDGREAKYKGKTNAQVLAIKQFEMAILNGDLSAAKEIADRVEGKVPQKSELSGANGTPIQFANVSPEENEKAIAALLSAQE